jgi:hypothetical protein
MNDQNPLPLSIFDRFAVFLGVKRDWKIIESKSMVVRQTDQYGWNEREVTKTVALERCAITKKERGYVYYGDNAHRNDREITANEARIKLALMK